MESFSGALVGSDSDSDEASAPARPHAWAPAPTGRAPRAYAARGQRTTRAPAARGRAQPRPYNKDLESLRAVHARWVTSAIADARGTGKAFRVELNNDIDDTLGRLEDVMGLPRAPGATPDARIARLEERDARTNWQAHVPWLLSSTKRHVQLSKRVAEPAFDLNEVARAVYETVGAALHANTLIPYDPKDLAAGVPIENPAVADAQDYETHKDMEVRAAKQRATDARIAAIHPASPEHIRALAVAITTALLPQVLAVLLLTGQITFVDLAKRLEPEDLAMFTDALLTEGNIRRLTRDSVTITRLSARIGDHPLLKNLALSNRTLLFVFLLCGFLMQLAMWTGMGPGGTHATGDTADGAGDAFGQRDASELVQYTDWNPEEEATDTYWDLAMSAPPDVGSRMLLIRTLARAAGHSAKFLVNGFGTDPLGFSNGIAWFAAISGRLLEGDIAGAGTTVVTAPLYVDLASALLAAHRLSGLTLAVRFTAARVRRLHAVTMTESEIAEMIPQTEWSYAKWNGRLVTDMEDMRRVLATLRNTLDADASGAGNISDEMRATLRAREPLILNKLAHFERTLWWTRNVRGMPANALRAMMPTSQFVAVQLPLGAALVSGWWATSLAYVAVPAFLFVGLVADPQRAPQNIRRRRGARDNVVILENSLRNREWIALSEQLRELSLDPITGWIDDDDFEKQLEAARGRITRRLIDEAGVTESAWLGAGRRILALVGIGGAGEAADEGGAAGDT